MLVALPPVFCKDDVAHEIVRTFEPGAQAGAWSTRRFLLSPEVVVNPDDGCIQLAHSLLMTDEMGATDFRQTETLGPKTWARKTLALDQNEASTAELFFYGSAQHIQWNGQPLDKSEPLVSTGWTRVRVPVRYLRRGPNEVVFSGSGGLLAEPSQRPGHSAKSTDGGQSWSEQTLTDQNNQQGEYIVRLRLGRYAPRGWAMSPVLDLWEDAAQTVAAPGTLHAIHALAALNRGQPAGTRLACSVRTGATTQVDKTWTDWVSLEHDYRPTGSAQRHRWAQLRCELATTRAQASPRLPACFQLTLRFQADRLPSADVWQVIYSGGRPEPWLTSLPFGYQEPSARLKLLRERYQLDKVIAPGKTEMEQLMLLRHWVRNQWHSAWGSHPAGWMPPWDALVILESRDQPDCLTMCTHYAAVFTQCCLALGWNARHCILDHHCVSEVWVDQHAKWVMMDAGNSSERADASLHFERKGVPQSARELHLARRTGQTADIQACFTPAALAASIAPLCRPAPNPGAKGTARPDAVGLFELAKYPVCQLDTYRRYGFPGRNNYLTSLVPGELYQGWSEYFYDGYWWVGDSPDNPRLSPEYSRHLDPARPQDIDWSLNGTRIYLARTAQPDELRVDLESGTPNLDHMEKSEGPAPASGQGAWQPVPAGFIWKLRAGRNELRVRGVNQFQRRGRETQLIVIKELKTDS
jgi:hypothetical protein